MCSTVIPISEASQIGEARRHAQRLSVENELSEALTGKVGIVATELGTNLIRHAQGGHLLIQIVPDKGSRAIELIAIDNGPGMADVQKCLQDGYSTAGTAGNGLGAVRRLSSKFDIFSVPGQGTAIGTRFSDELALFEPSAGFAVSAVCAPYPGETACGDAWSAAIEGSKLSLMVADGLGHGELAAEASNAAKEVFDRNPFASPSLILEAAHNRLRQTRGAAVTVAQLDLETRKMIYAGVGNISGSHIREGKSQGLISHNGTIGVAYRKSLELKFDLAERGLLILHSDGLQTRWSLDSYPGLAAREPNVIAATLYRDFRRGRDDTTVLAVRYSTR